MGKNNKMVKFNGRKFDNTRPDSLYIYISIIIHLLIFFIILMSMISGIGWKEGMVDKVGGMDYRS